MQAACQESCFPSEIVWFAPSSFLNLLADGTVPWPVRDYGIVCPGRMSLIPPRESATVALATGSSCRSAGISVGDTRALT
jgi:hypothetical protein